MLTKAEGKQECSAQCDMHIPGRTPRQQILKLNLGNKILHCHKIHTDLCSGRLGGFVRFDGDSAWQALYAVTNTTRNTKMPGLDL